MRSCLGNQELPGKGNVVCARMRPPAGFGVSGESQLSVTKIQS